MKISVGILMVVVIIFTGFVKKKTDFLTKKSVLLITLEKYDNSEDYEPLNKYERRFKILVDQYSGEDKQFDTDDDNYEIRFLDFDNIPYKGQEILDISVSKMSCWNYPQDGCNILVSVRVSASNYCREVENVIIVFNTETVEIDRKANTSTDRFSDWELRIELENTD